MAARDHADRIQLQQADALDDALERGLVAGSRALVQALLVDAEPLDGLAADGDGRGHGGEFSMGRGGFGIEFAKAILMSAPMI